MARNTLSMILGMGARTVGQGLVFVIVARILGAEGYGAYAAVLALAAALGGFAGLGVQVVMMREVARDSSCFGRAWGRVLAAIATSLPLLWILYALLCWVALPRGIDLGVIALIGISELVFAPLILAAIQAYQGHDRIGRASRLVFAPVLPRLGGALILLLLYQVLPNPELLTVWSALYAMASFLAMVYALHLVGRELGRAITPGWQELRNAMSEGLAFAFGGAALKLYADVDKTLIARLASLEAAGTYSAGYRITDLAMVPLYALLTSATSRFFKVGEGGVQAAIRYGWRLAPLPLLYSAGIGLGLYLSAGMLPVVLGEGYRDAVPALQWLAWLPLIALPRLLLQSLLVGADRQRAVVLIIGGGAISNVVCNLLFIPDWGWRGAVFSTYVVEIGMAWTLWRFSRKCRADC